jgi:hypothetical protein
VRELFPAPSSRPGLMVGGTDSRHFDAVQPTTSTASRRCARGPRTWRASTAPTNALRYANLAELIRFYHRLLSRAPLAPAGIPRQRRDPTMSQAVIVSTARTPLAKSWKGAFNMTHGATLGGLAVQPPSSAPASTLARSRTCMMGCANPEGATGLQHRAPDRAARRLPITVSGVTVNRFCSSGLQTIAMAAQRIIAGEGEVYVAGGVESISCVQHEMNMHMIDRPGAVKHKPEIYWNMLQTAEQVAKRYNMPRAHGRYGAASQQKACAAQEAGLFDDEIAPITVTAGVADDRCWACAARK